MWFRFELIENPEDLRSKQTMRWWIVVFVVLQLAFFALAIFGMIMVNEGMGLLALCGFGCMFLVLLVDIYTFERLGLNSIVCHRDDRPLDRAP